MVAGIVAEPVDFTPGPEQLSFRRRWRRQMKTGIAPEDKRTESRPWDASAPPPPTRPAAPRTPRRTRPPVPVAPLAGDSPAAAVLAALLAEPAGATVAVIAGTLASAPPPPGRPCSRTRRTAPQPASRAAGPASPTPGRPPPRRPACTARPRPPRLLARAAPPLLGSLPRPPLTTPLQAGKRMRAPSRGRTRRGTASVELTEPQQVRATGGALDLLATTALPCPSSTIFRERMKKGPQNGIYVVGQQCRGTRDQPAHDRYPRQRNAPHAGRRARTGPPASTRTGAFSHRGPCARLASCSCSPGRRPPAGRPVRGPDLTGRAERSVGRRD